MSTQMIVRIELDLKNKVDRLARTEGKTTSTIVRELLEEYVKNRDISAYIDNLWEKIGAKLSSKGITPGKIQIFIDAARKDK